MAYIGYNTGTRVLPDIYALAVPSGVVRIYQATHSCLCYNLYLYPTEAMHQRNKVCCIAVITLRNIKSVVITLRNIKSADQSYTEL